MVFNDLALFRKNKSTYDHLLAVIQSTIWTIFLLSFNFLHIRYYTLFKNTC